MMSKFRVWDIEHKIMEYIDDLYWFEENGVHDIVNGIAQGHNSTYRIMWYSGLKDKNNVKIYENDIVSFKDISTFITKWGCVKSYEFENRALFTWDNNRAQYTLTSFLDRKNSYYANDGFYEIDGVFISKSEVIRNKYEIINFVNKELSKSEELIIDKVNKKHGYEIICELHINDENVNLKE